MLLQFLKKLFPFTFTNFFNIFMFDIQHVVLSLHRVSNLPSYIQSLQMTLASTLRMFSVFRLVHFLL